MNTQRHDIFFQGSSRSLRRGLTLTETLLASGAILVACAAAAPILQSGKCDAARAQSQANLIILNQAHMSYATDWNDAQFTVAPGDYGAYNDCEDYQKEVGCIPPLILGESCEGQEYGFYFGCDGYGSCSNAPILQPIGFSSGGGWFRWWNLAPFNAYVNGRYYDPAFWAPDDYQPYEEASQYFDVDCSYGAPPDQYPVLSSYCLSAAALWNSDVLSQEYNGYRAPTSFDESYETPMVAECTYPELKTRMMEHNAIGHFWSEIPYFNPSMGSDTPWFFNQIANTWNLALFYDGSIGIMTVSAAVQSDQRVRRADDQSLGLWSRATPLGSGGYFNAQSWELSNDETSFHVLTIDGIRGRDTLFRGD